MGESSANQFGTVGRQTGEFFGGERKPLFCKILHVSHCGSRFCVAHAHFRMRNYFNMNILAFFREKKTEVPGQSMTGALSSLASHLFRNPGRCTCNMIPRSSGKTEGQFHNDRIGDDANSLFRKILRVSRLASRFYACPAQAVMRNSFKLNILDFPRRKIVGGT